MIKSELARGQEVSNEYASKSRYNDVDCYDILGVFLFVHEDGASFHPSI
jgi:hypothetical protein